MRNICSILKNIGAAAWNSFRRIDGGERCCSLVQCKQSRGVRVIISEADQDHRPTDQLTDAADDTKYIELRPVDTVSWCCPLGMVVGGGWWARSRELRLINSHEFTGGDGRQRRQSPEYLIMKHHMAELHLRFCQIWNPSWEDEPHPVGCCCCSLR